MKYIVAVSGGVDSVVLLDMMHKSGEDVVVAHFDHGIRSDSREDAQFVRELAYMYRYPFEGHREELGEQASEALARERRYRYLRKLAKKHDAKIMTAHHLDDVVETIAINFTRGTGWRGLAALDADIVRPLIDTEKTQLLEYAKTHKLFWREDSTNADTKYLRNRLRPKVHQLSNEQKRELRALHAHQKVLKREIDQEAHRLTGGGPDYSRYLVTHLPISSAIEVLRVITKGQLDRKQLLRALHAVKVARPGSSFDAGNGLTFHFTTRHFRL